MPDDLRNQIIEAIAAGGDDNYKRLLMLLLRVEEIFLERIEQLSDRMTEPTDEHHDDHVFVREQRRAVDMAKADGHKILVSIGEKAGWVAAGWMATKFFGA